MSSPADYVKNQFGQPIGFSLPNWNPPALPAREVLSGRYCRLEPLEPRKHGPALFREMGGKERESAWTYLPYGPFASLPDFIAWLETFCAGNDPLFFTISNPVGEPVGFSSYLRIAPEHGAIEVGHLLFGPRLEKTAAATEAMYLMMKHAFSIGYRRYEWKCDALNAPSRAAAQRLGFSFEGIFRQAVVYKGRTRDTAWFSIIDLEWPHLDQAFQRWLAPENFDSFGKQKTSLSKLTAETLNSRKNINPV